MRGKTLKKSRGNNKVRTYLITGGAGFIGSHLCKHLVDIQQKVICVDNFITGKVSNINDLFGDKYFRFIQHNVTEDLYLKDRVDYVLHFASPASPADYLKYPIQTLKVGSLGTHKMLGLAKEKGATFLLASTSEVYGDPLVHPQPETYWGNVNPVGVRGVYDEAKRFAESLVMAYSRVHKMNVRIARIFNTYGEQMRPNDGRAIPEFITAALKNKPINIYGTGKQTRSFCYISDTLHMLLMLLHGNYSNPVNIGNPEEMSINQLAKKIIKLTKSHSRIVRIDAMKDDPKVRRPDMKLAEKVLGKQSYYDIETGLERTIWYFKKLK